MDKAQVRRDLPSLFRLPSFPSSLLKPKPNVLANQPSVLTSQPNVLTTQPGGLTQPSVPTQPSVLTQPNVSLAPVNEIIHVWSGIEAITPALVCLGFLTVSSILCSICRKLQRAQKQINLILKDKGPKDGEGKEGPGLEEQPGGGIFRQAPKLRLQGPPTV